ncbi:MAG: hypothetical protein ABW195_11595 [Ilumatobacteraceae bacterium]
MTDPGYERPRFFDGERLTAQDLSAAQRYERDLRWLHNSTLHPWGVCRGLAVSGARGGATVKVGAGYALDCFGRDIIVAQDAVLQVPPVPIGTYLLTVSWADDDERAGSRRRGLCGTDGVVRIPEQGVLRWQDPDATEADARFTAGRDVVLAEVSVRGCTLTSAPDTGRRDETMVDCPYVSAGATVAGDTSWRLWPDDTTPRGVSTTVSTASAAFARAPCYQVSVIGERMFRAADGSVAVVDGPVSLDVPTASSVEVRVELTEVGGLNPPEVFDLSFPERLRDELSWYVAWIGVET